MQARAHLKVGRVNPVLVIEWVRASCKVRWCFCASLCDDCAACLYPKKVEGAAFCLLRGN